METPAPSHALYTCSLKLILRRGDAYLVLRDAEGYIDLPGGRIDNDERSISIPEILQREITEELGSALQYQLGAPAFQFRRDFDTDDTHVLVSVYFADYLSGDIQLSDEHKTAQWLTKEELHFRESDFRQHEEYLAFQNFARTYGQ